MSELPLKRGRMHGSVRAMRARALQAQTSNVGVGEVVLGLSVVGIGFLIGRALGRWWKSSRQETPHTLH